MLLSSFKNQIQSLVQLANQRRTRHDHHFQEIAIIFQHFLPQNYVYHSKISTFIYIYLFIDLYLPRIASSVLIALLSMRVLRSTQRSVHGLSDYQNYVTTEFIFTLEVNCSKFVMYPLNIL